MHGRMHKRTHTRTDACTCACKDVPVPMQCSAMCCTATGLPAFEDWGDEAEVLCGIEHLPVPRLGTTGASIWLCPVSQNSIERPVTTTGVSDCICDVRPVTEVEDSKRKIVLKPPATFDKQSDTDTSENRKLEP